MISNLSWAVVICPYRCFSAHHMAALRSFLKRKVSQHTSHHHLHPTATNTSADSSSDTSASSTPERSNQQRNDGYNSTSTLGVSTINSDDSARRPLLHLRSANRRKKVANRLVENTTAAAAEAMKNQQEITIDNNTCLLERKLPRELILRWENRAWDRCKLIRFSSRIFSHLDYQSLCRSAQVSKVPIVLFSLVLSHSCCRSIGTH